MKIEYDYVPSRDDVFRFAQSVGARTREKGNELVFLYCPVCHGGPHKDKNTFSMNTKSGLCSCQRSSCRYKGNLISLAREFEEFNLADDVSRYYNIKGINEFREFKEYHRESTDRAIQYLKDRGISEHIAKKYEITTKEDQDSVLVFPFKDETGKLKFIKYRNMDFVKGVSNGSKEWCEKKCMPILFGMNHCDPNNETLIITEGQIDSLSLAEAGFTNAISVPTGMNGFTWIPHCWDWINKHKKIIVFGDNENGKMTLLDTIKSRFSLAVLSVRIEDYKGCKDANEILQKHGPEQLKVCVTNAEILPTKNMDKLSNVKSMNAYETEKLMTGIYEVDKCLHGGIPFGGITNIIGKTGEGKSTLASQIIAQALNQGYKCFIYSGELSNSSFKEALDRQLAGNHVIAYQDDTMWHDTRYFVSEADIEKMNLWYKDRCFIYSDAIFNDDLEPLITTIENDIRQYETRVVLIDNLMTALDLEPNEGKDRYEKQSLFVKKVARLAVKHNVLILMVAHKRKDGCGDENDQIMGSSDIGNLSMVTLSYGRDANIADENHRRLKISKNRLFGKINTNGWDLDYDEKSKRIFGKDDDVNMEYGWSDYEGFVPEENTLEDIPF